MVSADHVQCTGCPAGRAPNFERTTCDACEGLTYSPLGTSCEQCEGDNVVNDRRTTVKRPTHPTRCVTGVYFLMTVLWRALEQRMKVVGFQCSACIAGSGPVNGRTACAGCNGTTYSQIGVCDDCPAPSVVSDDHVRCYGCPAGLAPNAERNACVACASLDGLTYSPLGTSCDDCEGDAVVNNRRTSCLAVSKSVAISCRCRQAAAHRKSRAFSVYGRIRAERQPDRL